MGFIPGAESRAWAGFSRTFYGLVGKAPRLAWSLTGFIACLNLKKYLPDKIFNCNSTYGNPLTNFPPRVKSLNYFCTIFMIEISFPFSRIWQIMLKKSLLNNAQWWRKPSVRRWDLSLKHLALIQWIPRNLAGVVHTIYLIATCAKDPLLDLKVKLRLLVIILDFKICRILISLED